MRIRPYPLILILIVILFLFSASSVFATSFSVATGATTPALPDDILVPGPAPIIFGATPPVEVDAFSFGHLGVGLGDIPGVEFSVAPFSFGVAGSAVFSEAVTFGFQPQADIFASSFGGTNVLLFDGDGSSGPPLGLIEAPFGPDDVDGYDRNPGPLLGPAPGLIWFSYGGSPGIEADVYVAPAATGYSTPTPTLFAGSAALGLLAADNLDALVVLEDGVGLGGTMAGGDCVLFSLAAGSPSLASLGFSADDILHTGPGCPGVGLFAPAASIGLSGSDDLNALSIPFTPTAVTLQEISFQPDYGTMPVLMTSSVLAILGLSMYIRRRRRNRVTVM